MSRLWGLAPEDLVSCPGCGDTMPPSLLCECDEDSGPLCVDRCCGRDHGLDGAA